MRGTVGEFRPPARQPDNHVFKKGRESDRVRRGGSERAARLRRHSGRAEPGAIVHHANVAAVCGGAMPGLRAEGKRQGEQAQGGMGGGCCSTGRTSPGTRLSSPTCSGPIRTSAVRMAREPDLKCRFILRIYKKLDAAFRLDRWDISRGEPLLADGFQRDL